MDTRIGNYAMDTDSDIQQILTEQWSGAWQVVSEFTVALAATIFSKQVTFGWVLIPCIAMPVEGK